MSTLNDDEETVSKVSFQCYLQIRMFGISVLFLEVLQRGRHPETAIAHASERCPFHGRHKYISTIDDFSMDDPWKHERVRTCPSRYEPSRIGRSKVPQFITMLTQHNLVDGDLRGAAVPPFFCGYTRKFERRTFFFYIFIENNYSQL